MRYAAKSKESGFHIIEAVLIIAIIGILAAVGYYAYTNVFAPRLEPVSEKTVAPSPGSKVPPTKEELDRMKSVSNSF